MKKLYNAQKARGSFHGNGHGILIGVVHGTSHQRLLFMKKNKVISFRGEPGFCSFLFFLLLGFSLMGKAASAAPMGPFADGLLFLPDGSSITMEQFAAQAAGADYILVGETHDAPHHHQMQARLLESLAAAGQRPVVGFEMLYSRKQNLLDSFNRREIKVEALEEAAEWAKSWSYPFAIYAPIFQVAEQYDLPVYGLNISKATLDLVKKNGFEETHKTVPAEEIPDLPHEVIWPKPEQVEALAKVREGFARSQAEAAPKKDGQPEAAKAEAPEKAKPAEGGPMQPGDLKRFMLVQSLWDTSMAESAIKAHEATGRPVLIIAGSGHVESGFGIAHRINTLTPGKKIILVLPVSYPLEEGDKKRQSGDVFFASRPGILSLGLVFKPEAERIIVDEVRDGSRAAAAGIKAGDRIVSLEDKALEGPGGLHSAIAIADLKDKRDGLDEKRAKPLAIERDGRSQALTLH